MKKQKHIGVRLEEELLRKFKILCIYEGRSVPKQIWYMIKCSIEQFETENGRIVFDRNEETE